ncbi:hypothetical protein JW992_14975, partial [candidate division KSB1 bacterium]|nr:hypothetical protein [candidate division KSB1 bacterium]
LRRKEQYDLIVCGVGAPASAQSNRYYTREFYVLVQTRLAAGGRFVVLGLPAGENYLGEELLQLNASVDATLRTVFPHVLYLPGDCSTFIAAIDEEPEQDAGVLTARLQESGLIFPYFWPQQIRFFYQPDRLQQFAAVLEDTRPVINSDFRPVGYYLDFLAWNKRLGGPQALFEQIRRNATTGTRLLFAVIAVFGLLFTHWVTRHRRGWRYGLYASGLLLGYMAMTAQIVLLLALQAGRGYLYSEIGFALAAFMAGMATAAGSAIQLIRGRFHHLVLIGYLLLATLIVAILPQLLKLLFVHSDLKLFLILFFVCGALGGFFFPLYTSIDAGLRGRLDSGRIYAFDLWGGALGALVPAGLGIPLIGFHGSLGLLAATLAVAAFFFIRTRFLFPLR